LLMYFSSVTYCSPKPQNPFDLFAILNSDE